MLPKTISCPLCKRCVVNEKDKTGRSCIYGGPFTGYRIITDKPKDSK